MKNILTSVILFVGLVPVIVSAQQASNTVNFKGQVSSQTCQVTINGESTTPVVLLPTVPDTSLANSGATAGDTSFSIEISKCTPGVKATTWLAGTVVSINGNIANTGGTATNVAIQLVDGLTSIVIPGAQHTSEVVIDTAGNATVPLVARYYAEAPVTAGSVVGNAYYVVMYN